MEAPIRQDLLSNARNALGGAALLDQDILGDAIERLEWSEKRSGEHSRAAQITRRTALTGGAAGLAATLLAACGGSGAAIGDAHGAGGNISSIFGHSGGYRFTVVNHATANTVFTATQNGVQDACKLLNCSYQWTGSGSGSVAAMVGAINTAVAAGVDGIATSLIAKGSFDKPVAAALEAGIPVVSYNADVATNPRLAYIGQDLVRSGQEMGRRIQALMPRGGRITVFIATPGSANLQPRLDGLRQVLHGTNITVHSEASAASEPQELTSIETFVGNNLRAYDGYFAVDGGSTEAVAQAIQKYNLHTRGVLGGGFDLTQVTQQSLQSGYIQFAIDQQPYLQGFLPILELFLHRISAGLTGIADVDTGVKLVDRESVKPYVSTMSRFEGTGTTPGVQHA